MCGFAGIVGAEPQNPAHIEQILASRGPDARGEYRSNGVWLLHRRLAVVDLDERSNQPFQLPDGTALVYNGELYNHRSFEHEIDIRNTEGDTEVVAQLGDSVEAVSRFRGMYAYALHRPDGTVTLVRDRVGIKPLYIKVVGESLMYASQLRCFTYELGGARLSVQAAASFLRFGSVVSPTMYEGVFELLPGHMLTWKNGRVESIVPTPASSVPESTIGDALRSSIQRHLVSDAPTCLLLSGGLDSAVLAKLVAEESSQQIDAVTLSVGGHLDEVALAQRTASNYGLRLHTAEISADDARQSAATFFDAIDQPTIDGFNTFLLASAVNKLGFTVGLSGLGADELFGGYPIFRNAAGIQALSPFPDVLAERIVRSAGKGLNPGKLNRITAARRDPWHLAEIDRELRTAQEVEALLGVAGSNIRPNLRLGDPLVDAQFSLYMQPRLLRDADAFSMASSLELRVPFLDDDVICAALREPGYRRGLIGKRSLVKAFDDDFLTDVFSRTKKGFDLPMAEWFDMDSTSEVPWGVAWSDRILAEWTERHIPIRAGHHA